MTTISSVSVLANKMINKTLSSKLVLPGYITENSEKFHFTLLFNTPSVYVQKVFFFFQRTEYIKEEEQKKILSSFLFVFPIPCNTRNHLKLDKFYFIMTCFPAGNTFFVCVRFFFCSHTWKNSVIGFSSPFQHLIHIYTIPLILMMVKVTQNEERTKKKLCSLVW